MAVFTKVSIVLFAMTIFASAQDKPRVFVQGKGSQDINSDGSAAGGRHWGAFSARSTVDSHDESMEVTKDLQKDCTSVVVTLNASNADYTVLMNRESKKNRGLLRSNSQVEVANRAGDILGTSATHTVGNAAKDACQLITSDWQTHGRVAATASAPVTSPAAQQSVAASVTPGGAVAVATPVAPPDAATLAKQHQACLDLAKDNPSIVCK